MTTLSEIKAQYLAAAKAKPIEKYCIKNHEGKIVARSNSPVVHVFMKRMTHTPLSITSSRKPTTA